jgi:phytoene desaturase
VITEAAVGGVQRGTGARSARVVVIGAGLGGLACALRLLSAGMEVTVVEAAPSPGGRAGQLREQGYTFDTGPSLITMPQLLDELFALAGTKTADQLRLHRLEPFYRIHWWSQLRHFDFSSDAEGMTEQIGQFSPRDAHRYQEFLAHSRRIYEQAILGAGRRPFLHARDMVGLVPRMIRLGAIRSVEHFVDSYFEEPHVRQAFSFHPLFIGGDPYRVPAVYAALAYLQIESGVWYAEGGVYALVEALVRLLAGQAGLHLGDPVVEIQSRDGRVTGVRTESGVVHPADYVVSNADVVETTRLLLADRAAPSPQPTMSCFLLYLGTNRVFDRLAHHTLLVGEDYQGFIRDVTRLGRLGRSPSLYLHAPARTEAAMAPAGGDSLSVLLPVPNLQSRLDWKEAEARVRRQVLDAMESDQGLGLTGLRDSLVLERSWTPLDYKVRLRAHLGNAFGPEPTLLQSAYFRQPNRDRRLRGLYHVGAGTHPGAGIPGVLLGAEVTSQLLLEEAAAWR